MVDGGEGGLEGHSWGRGQAQRGRGTRKIQQDFTQPWKAITLTHPGPWIPLLVGRSCFQKETKEEAHHLAGNLKRQMVCLVSCLGGSDPGRDWPRRKERRKLESQSDSL